MIVFAKCDIEHTDGDGHKNDFKKNTAFRIATRDKDVVDVVDAEGHHMLVPSDKFDRIFKCQELRAVGA